MYREQSGGHENIGDKTEGTKTETKRYKQRRSQKEKQRRRRRGMYRDKAVDTKT